MDRGVASLTGSTAKVTFERVTHQVKASKATGEPTLSSRNRHIFDLKRSEKDEHSVAKPKSSLPDYYIQSQSRRTLGSFGVRKQRGRSKWIVAEIGTKAAKDYGIPDFIQDGRLLADVVVEDGITCWIDGEGNTMATEDHTEGQHTITVTKELPQSTVDALVAVWCCRMWQYSAKHTPKLDGGVEGCKLTRMIAMNTADTWTVKKKLRHISGLSVLFRASQVI